MSNFVDYDKNDDYENYCDQDVNDENVAKDDDDYDSFGGDYDYAGFLSSFPNNCGKTCQTSL